MSNPADTSITDDRLGAWLVQALLDATQEEAVYQGIKREMRIPERANRIMSALEVVVRAQVTSDQSAKKS